MRAIILVLLFAGQCFANPPWIANYERAKILLPAIDDDSSQTAKAWRKEVNRMIERGRTDNEIPLDAAKRVLAKMSAPPTPKPTMRERLVAAGSTEFAEKKKPIEPEQKPVIVYPTGGGNYRASDGTIIIRSGDGGFIVVPKK